MKTLLSMVILAVASAAALAQSQSVVHSAHNLSASGPGAVRATSEEQVCIFCHTPHHASPVQPLWNRSVPTVSYNVYVSDSLNALPGQPTGSSKLCLSCHDGTIALGSIVSRHLPINMVGGVTTMPLGRSNLGTDLSDDHPISFRYDSELALKNPSLTPPAQLPPTTRLDARREMQCTSCHNPHNNQFGQFLVMDNQNSQLCRSCHIQGSTDIDEHQQCASCHTPHAAPSGAYLLQSRTVTQTCNNCHQSVAADLNKISRHDTSHQPGGASVIGAVRCNDCHQQHTMRSTGAVAPLISPKLGQVAGINSAGAPVTPAQYEYEVCLKCHGDTNAVQPVVDRQVAQNNRRLQTGPSAVSFHPIQTPGRSDDVPSLRPGLTTASMIYCSDCHRSDAALIGNGGGPHGSNTAPLLAAPYSTLDGSAESPSAYALCYACHERSSILSNESFPHHERHVVTNNTPCSACHDAHGIASGQGTAVNHSHLINFDISIVEPHPVSQRLDYRKTGSRSGTCTLKCHNYVHTDTEY